MFEGAGDDFCDEPPWFRVLLFVFHPVLENFSGDLGCPWCLVILESLDYRDDFVFSRCVVVDGEVCCLVYPCVWESQVGLWVSLGIVSARC